MSETDEAFLERMTGTSREFSSVAQCVYEPDYARLLSLARRGAAVPDEPDNNMLDAGRQAWKAPRMRVNHTASDERGTCAVIYSAMLAAALKD